MDLLKQSIIDMSEMFHKKMAEFQKDLQHSPASSKSPSSIDKLTSDFSTFKTFVLFALNSLQQQVELISRQQNQMETRSRRKMLLVHGVPESNKENVSVTMLKLISDHLEVTEFSTDSIAQSHRMGRPSLKKPRPIIMKFQDTSSRDKIWFSKTGFKRSGITVSEFLTKSRHNTFLKARERFGISNCWTREGCIFVLGPDGTWHSVVSPAELDAIPGPAIVSPGITVVAPGPSIIALAAIISKENKSTTHRPKRLIAKPK